MRSDIGRDLRGSRSLASKHAQTSTGGCDAHTNRQQKVLDSIFSQLHLGLIIMFRRAGQSLAAGGMYPAT